MSIGTVQEEAAKMVRRKVTSDWDKIGLKIYAGCLAQWTHCDMKTARAELAKAILAQPFIYHLILDGIYPDVREGD